MDYVPAGIARFTILSGAEGQGIDIPAQRPPFVIAFLTVWLLGWTIGGVFAIGQVMTGFNAFLLVWLGGWALGMVMVLQQLLWLTFGTERLRVLSGDLQVSRRALGIGATRLFRGADISDWTLVHTPVWQGRRGMRSPFAFKGEGGTIRFTYGARSIDLAAGLDDAEARQILGWLKQHLPGKGQTP
jgi:hypothetical protein